MQRLAVLPLLIFLTASCAGQVKAEIAQTKFVPPTVEDVQELNDHLSRVLEAPQSGPSLTEMIDAIDVAPENAKPQDRQYAAGCHADLQLYSRVPLNRWKEFSDHELWVVATRDFDCIEQQSLLSRRDLLLWLDVETSIYDALSDEHDEALAQMAQFTHQHNDLVNKYKELIAQYNQLLMDFRSVSGGLHSQPTRVPQHQQSLHCTLQTIENFTYMNCD